MRTLDLVKILQHYGEEHQYQKLVEELGELLIAVSRRLTTQDYDEILKAEENVVEEMADVMVLMNQLTISIGALGKREDYYNAKVNRQLERIKRDE